MDENQATATALEPADAGALVAMIKSGWKTSELWITFLIVGYGVALTSGLIGDGSTVAKIVGGAMATIKGVMYTLSRTKLKAAAS
jgi:hypothetical protein